MRKLLHATGKCEVVKQRGHCPLSDWVSDGWVHGGGLGWDWKECLMKNLRNAVEKIVKFTNNVSLSTRAITRIGLSGSWTGAGGAGM